MHLVHIATTELQRVSRFMLQNLSQTFGTGERRVSGEEVYTQTFCAGRKTSLMNELLPGTGGYRPVH
ncbi:hypothetical protein L798_05424 [Zootermopsis nevadensis]|uniref:Uncharacterized protein n=1 Tax=Zootermopsis nevadensis TaxID=136037 RepID=A0A067R9K6_ZOONE|nr:hypothetical protein L798_05424 [Zootermopsis nevadensis]